MRTLHPNHPGHVEHGPSSTNRHREIDAPEEEDDAGFATGEQDKGFCKREQEEGARLVHDQTVSAADSVNQPFM